MEGGFGGAAETGAQRGGRMTRKSASVYDHRSVVTVKGMWAEV